MPFVEKIHEVHMLGSGPPGRRLPVPHSREPVLLQLDTACQVAPGERKLGASSAKGVGEGWGKTEGEQALLVRGTSLLLQRWCLKRLMAFLYVISIWFLAHRFNQKKKRKHGEASNPKRRS